jgi:bifunctional enzyme CysN/CysC
VKVAFVGNVDHGKSTLIGRLLSDCEQISKERSERVQKYCENTKQKYEYAYLLDALEEEQSQGITIDTTEKRFQYRDTSFLFVDTPGHFEFLKKMIGGASRVDVAVFLLDVNEEISTVFLRQNKILDILGVKNRIVLLNKMDVSNWNEVLFRKQEETVRKILSNLNVQVLPISAYWGENLFESSKKMPWHKGDSFLDALIGLKKQKEEYSDTYRITVQDAYRWDEKRIFVGRVEAGSIHVNDRIHFLPSGEFSRIKTLEYFDESRSVALAGEAIGFTLEDPIYLERGSVGYSESSAPYYRSELLVDVFWLKQQPLMIGDRVKVKNGTLTGVASVEKILFELEANELKEIPLSKKVHIFGRIQLKFDTPWVFDSFASIQEMGRMVFFQDLQPVGGGIVVEDHARHDHRIDSQIDTENKVIWFTGLSGAGKSTLAIHLAKNLSKNHKVKILDGDHVRNGLCKDLGFSESDRRENVRRVAEVAKLFQEEGYFVIVALISPIETDRTLARSIVGNAFREVYIDCSLAVCEARDVKGLYKKARSGKIFQFTGIDSQYEVPSRPDLTVNTSEFTESESMEKILRFLHNNNSFVSP